MPTLIQRLFGEDKGPLPPHEGVEHLVLYKFDSCPYCVRVMSSIERLGVDVEYRDTRADQAARAELLDKTGRAQVPCLFIDGEPLFESRDIITWLERFAA